MAFLGLACHRDHLALVAGRRQGLFFHVKAQLGQQLQQVAFELVELGGLHRVFNIDLLAPPLDLVGGVLGQFEALGKGIGLLLALAQEGAKFGVTVNAIAPGYIDTDMVAAVPEPVLEKIVAKIPVGRLGQAEEIARGVAFFTSENGAFMTGSTMSINGGQHMY